MKKILFLFLLLPTLLHAGVTVGGSIMINNNWVPLPDCEGIQVIFEGNVIIIESNERQIFYLQDYTDIHFNTSGHQQIKSNAIDKEGRRCLIRIVSRPDMYIEPILQLYIHYNNIDYVYDIKSP